MHREKVVVYGIHLLASMVVEASSSYWQWWQILASPELLLGQAELRQLGARWHGC